MLKILDLGLGKLVLSVHGREVFLKKNIFILNPMLKILDLGLGKLVPSVHSRELFFHTKIFLFLTLC